ncbi:MAG: aminomethyl-transferring glycine dehydrogenase subunit GcvPB [Deltaproteobacteria bacterium]|nr:aminomethyl-transferring glycine dehydrogenase subunit GcvPB [Deltaproteobacteria bacterium]
MSKAPTKVTQGLLHCERPIFAASVPGRSGASLPTLDVPEPAADAWPAALRRASTPHLPEVSEPQVVRHYTRLSQWNFSIDTGMYPLGSCTMKHNPRVADVAVGMGEFARLHPYQPESQLQGALQLLWELEQMLAAVGGFSRVSLQPAAGAHGELAGLMMIRAYHTDRGQTRRRVLIPDSAHGTNPASCTLNGFEAVQLETSADGTLSPDTVRAALDDEVAAIMITNPNTLGIFEKHVAEIAEMVRGAGGLIYMDGANLNAIMGRFRPGDVGVDAMHYNLHKTFGTPHGGGGPGAGPVGVSERLVPFLPVPTVNRSKEGFTLDYGRPKSVGRLRSFFGNFGVLLRAYVYMRELGAPGLARVTDLAVLNANYVRARIRDFVHVPHPDMCMHEVVANDQNLRSTGATTMDVAKRLIDHGFHPPTVYFPLVVHGAMMIEPTETETPDELDAFIEALRSVVEEAHKQPEQLKSAPHVTGIGRLDEARAARKPHLRYQPAGEDES